MIATEYFSIGSGSFKGKYIFPNLSGEILILKSKDNNIREIWSICGNKCNLVNMTKSYSKNEDQLMFNLKNQITNHFSNIKQYFDPFNKNFGLSSVFRLNSAFDQVKFCVKLVNTFSNINN